MAEYIDEYIRKNDVYNLKNAFSSLIKEESTKHDGIEWVIYNRASESVLNMIERGVQEIPAADVASVVRCKECEFHTFLGKCKVHSQEPDQYGPGHDVTTAPDDFCSYGKRKQLEE